MAGPKSINGNEVRPFFEILTAKIPQSLEIYKLTFLEIFLDQPYKSLYQSEIQPDK
jgi:hypothetical protein